MQLDAVVCPTCPPASPEQHRWATVQDMCRSIKTLRPPYLDNVSTDDVHAAALQYVRKVAGMRRPARVNEEVFDAAVEEVSAATERLLSGLTLPARSAAAAVLDSAAG